MKSVPLSYEERIATGMTHKILIDYTDLTDTAGLTKTLEAFPVAAGQTIRKAASKVLVAFAGCATLVAEVGDGGDVDRLMASHNMKATAGTRVVAVPSSVPYAYTGDDTLDVKFTATTNNLTELTAGQVAILVEVSDLAQHDGE